MEVSKNEKKREKLMEDPKGFMEAGGSVRFVCSVCSSFLNSLKQVDHHNRGE